MLADHFGDDPALLVLDNLEQVVAAAPDLEELLARCSRLTVLATSRTLLRLRAEHEFVVRPLATGTKREDLATDETMALPAVRLFLERASAVRRGIPSDPESVAAIAEICRRLDGVPLAIELAAARTRLLDPVALLARLESVLDSLGTGPVDLPERQRTLRATIEWSIGLLSPEQARLLAVLSVFTDGWTLDAAAAVSGETEDSVLELLDGLVGQSLVSVDAGVAPRFRMLAAVQEFAAEQLLASGDREATEARHAQHFASMIELPITAEQIQSWADDLLADDENVRRAITWFFANDPARLPHLLRSLWTDWQLHDRMPEGRRWISDLRDSLDLSDLDVTSRGELLFTDAVTAVEVGDDDGALRAIAQIRELLPEIQEPALRYALLLAEAWGLPIDDQLDEALLAANAAYAGFRESRNPFMAFAALTAGMIQTALGQDDDARRHLMEVDELGARYSAYWLTASARNLLAGLAVRAGDVDGARRLICRGMDGADDSQIGTLIACFTMVAYAQVAVAEGDLSTASTALAAVDAQRRRAGLLAWPNSRRSEAALRAEIRGQMDLREWQESVERGSLLTKRDALSLVRRGIDCG